MVKFVFIFIVLLGILGFVFFVSANKKQQTPSSPTPSPSTQIKQINKVGFTLTPKSFNQQDFVGFFEKVKSVGNIVSWSGKTEELKNTSAAPFVVIKLANQYSYTPVILVSEVNSEILVDFAKNNKPPYLGIGVEVNRLSSAEFNNFASQFNEVYDKIKTVSQDTKVFTVFQLENMKGLQGGLFGKDNNPNNNQWVLLDKVSKADFIGFTTYPGLIYKNPNDIPLNYYSEISNHTQKKIVFTEIGWQSQGNQKGWESSEDEQSLFVERFFNLTTSVKKEFVIWSFMYDQNIKEPFNSMGLLDKDGKEKKAWKIWEVTH